MTSACLFGIVINTRGLLCVFRTDELCIFLWHKNNWPAYQWTQVFIGQGSYVQVYSITQRYINEIMKEILVKSASVHFRRNKKKFCITLSTESSVGSAFHTEKNEQKIAKNYDMIYCLEKRMSHSTY